MVKYFGNISYVVLFLVFTSCITDEFKFGEIKVKDDFRTEIIAPLFSGNLEFNDFLDVGKSPGSGLNDTVVYLKYDSGLVVKIPNSFIFEPYVLLDSFPIVIQGSYELTSITLEFRVTNGSPFPLNLKLRFYENTTPNNLGPSIQPPPFDEGISNTPDISPVETIHQMQLNDEQRISFMNGNRIQFTTWFDKTDFLHENDTLNANYPVKISVILLGEVKATNEDK